MSSRNEKPGSHIAIRFGSHSQPKKPSRDPQPPPTLGKRTRTFDADSDDEDEDDRNTGRVEAISGFGADGAEAESARKSTQQNRTIQRNPRPASTSSRSNGQSTVNDEAEEKPVQWGLNVTKSSRSTKKEGQGKEGPRRRNDGDQDGYEETPKERSLDQEALDSLMDKDVAPKRKYLLKPAPLEGGGEDQDKVSTLRDYEDTPVEGFGAALLRGMGWDGKDRGPKVREPKKREAHLALGATKLKEAEDLGGWGHNKKRPRLSEYRKEAEKKKEARETGSYRSDRDRDRDSGRGGEMERDRDGGRYRRRDGDRDRHRSEREREPERERNRDRDRDRDRDRRRHDDRDRR